MGLLAAGCQPWNKDICAASGDRFAYCATLAVYIYQVRSFLFIRLVTFLCSCWSHFEPIRQMFLQCFWKYGCCWEDVYVKLSIPFKIPLKLYVSRIIFRRQAHSAANIWDKWSSVIEDWVPREKWSNSTIPFESVVQNNILHSGLKWFKVVDSVAHLWFGAWSPQHCDLLKFAVAVHQHLTKK